MLAIGLERMSNKNSQPPFPLHYFIQTIRSRIFYILVTTFVVSLIHQTPALELYPSLFVAISALCGLSIIFSLWRIKPFTKILRRLSAIDFKIDHDQQIDLLYRKNEWDIVGGMLAIIEDEISTQKTKIEAQDLLSHKVLSVIPSGIVLVDRFQNIIQSNQSFRSIFNSGDESKLWKIVKDEKLRAVVEDCIDNKRKNDSFGILINNTYYDISLTPIIDDNDELTGLVGIFHDVTKSKLTEKMRVDFVANVSHEIRTPLTSIKGYAQLLSAQTENLPESVLNISNKINSNTERLKDLFENLLKLSKIESQNEIVIEEIDLELLLKKVKSDLEAKYRNKKIHFSFDLKSRTTCGDLKLLEQVFINILDNSIKYSQKDPIIIIESNANGPKSGIKITDNGPGISEKEIGRIFERFYRVQGESQTLVEGTGLGLSIVKHIINKHHGDVSVKSEVGIGTSFTISLPCEVKCSN